MNTVIFSIYDYCYSSALFLTNEPSFMFSDNTYKEEISAATDIIKE